MDTDEAFRKFAFLQTEEGVDEEEIQQIEREQLAKLNWQDDESLVAIQTIRLPYCDSCEVQSR